MDDTKRRETIERLLRHAAFADFHAQQSPKGSAEHVRLVAAAADYRRQVEKMESEEER